MKQSSIDWFYQKLVDRQNGHGDSRSIDEIFQQAKAMHKEEQIDTLINGIHKGQEMYFSEDKIKVDVNSLDYCIEIAEQYYKD